MNDWVVENKGWVNIGVLVATLVAVSIILGFGYEAPAQVPEGIEVGQPSPEKFVANQTTSEIEDPDKTESAQTAAANQVPAPFSQDPNINQGVFTAINVFYRELEDGAFGEPPVIPETTVPNVVGMSLSDAEASAAAASISLEVVSLIEPLDEESDGTIASQLKAPDTVVPEGFVLGVNQFLLGASSTTVDETTTTTTEPPTSDLPRINRQTQIETLLVSNPVLDVRTVTLFVDLHESDIDRVAAGEESVFPEMQSTSLEWAKNELDAGIRDQGDLDDAVAKYRNPETIPPITIAGLSSDDLDATREAMGGLVARRLSQNESVDNALWEIEKQAARDAVPLQTTTYRFGDVIAADGEILTSVQVEAITELGLFDPVVSATVPLSALILFGIIIIIITAFLLERIAPKNFDRPRRVALMGIILTLAAAASRIPEIVSGADHAVGYIIPAVAVGVMAAILFDQRTALLLAIPMAGFTAISTGDIAFTVYAGIAAAIPVAFVSSVSTRSQLRLSVLGSAAVAAPVAAGLEYLFIPDHTAAASLQAGGWAFVGAVVGGFIGQGLVSFLENAFGVTTSMSLLDLLDRNHPALQLLEEHAPGTFNHSMLVGSIAGKAARSIEADPLLAQAAAWYHDLGKTENPQYFVENQLGYNPHDELSPEDSAEIIRGHVTEGLALATQYRIPEEVANGIRMHHGTSLMRYFYHKALTEDPDTDPEAFRHHGEKPTRKEMAIVMIADATEAAARAYAQSEQPTEEGLAKLVDTIVSEKLDDGQFDKSSLTFGELTTIKREVVAALSAYYHARVEYPDFPEVVSAEGS
jgi:putative nucleotidyltransferase with HDIG domain